MRGLTVLDGVKVVDFGQYIAAPGATSLLANLGADVVKVEPLTGETTRSMGSFGAGMFQAYNCGKRAIAVNLRTDEGRKVAQRLVEEADVVVENMRSGVMEKLGLGERECRERNPGLIYVSVSGFGTEGPSRTRPGFDIAAQAESGVMSLTGEADGEPMRVGFSIIDAATTHACAQSILAALFARERSSDRRGDRVEISLLDVAVQLQAPNWAEYFATGIVPTRKGNGQPTVAPAADLVETADGYVVISAYTEEHWARLCQLIGREDLTTDPNFATNQARVTNRPALHRIINESVGDQTAEELVSWLAQNGIVAGNVRDYEQVLQSADVTASSIFMRHCDASVPQVGSPYKIGGVRPGGLPDASALGQHSVEILDELGYQDAEIEALLDTHIVSAPDLVRD